MVGWLMNNGLERIWKDYYIKYFDCNASILQSLLNRDLICGIFRNLPEGLMIITNNRSPDKDLNLGLSEYNAGINILKN
jgi:hypothetical protein